MPTRVLFGSGQLNRLHEAKLPGKKALIDTSNGQSAQKVWEMSCLMKSVRILPERT